MMKVRNAVLEINRERTVIRHGSYLKHADPGLNEEIIASCFADKPHPTRLDLYNELVVEENEPKKPLT